MTSALLLLLIAQSATPATATPTSATPAPELLRLKSTVDQRFEFGLKMEMGITVKEPDAAAATKGEAQTMRASFLFAERVLRIEGESTTSRRYIKALSIEGSGLIGKSMADQFREIANGTYEVVLDPRGDAPKQGNPTGAALAGVVGLVFPEAPVAPGESWEGIYSANEGIRLRYTLRGIAPVGDRRVALIDVSGVAEAPVGFTVKPGGLMAIDLADGRWLRSSLAFILDREVGGFDMKYDLARTGAPEWPTILAAFPAR